MFTRQFAATLLTLTISTSSLTLFAQDKPSSEPEARIGLKGGLSIATIIKTDDNSFKSDPLYGFNGGLVLQLPLGRVIAIQPEVLFSQKGYHATGSGLVSDYDYRRTLNCLDVPLLLRINASDVLGLVVGPQYSWLMKTNTSFKSADASYQQSVKNEDGSLTKNTFGGVVGLDVNLNHNVFLYGRYTIDFKNNNGDGTSSTPAYKNQVFQCGLGVLF